MPTTTGAACSYCGFPIAVSPSQVGTIVACPNCGASNEIVATRGRARIANIAQGGVGYQTVFLTLFVGTISGFLLGHYVTLKRRASVAPLGK